MLRGARELSREGKGESKGVYMVPISSLYAAYMLLRTFQDKSTLLFPSPAQVFNLPVRRVVIQAERQTIEVRPIFACVTK